MKKILILFFILTFTLMIGSNRVSGADGDTTAPSILVVAPPKLQITDRYLTLSAIVTDDSGLASKDPVVAYYRVDENLPYQKVILTRGENDTFSAMIDTYVQFGTNKENKKFFTDKVFYYIEAKDSSNNIAKSQVNIVECDQYYGDVYDYNNVPYLLITELMVSTSAKGIGNGDRYEFVEIYNNSTTPIDFSGFELRYMTNPSLRPTEYTLRNPENRNLIIQPQSTIIIWVNTNDWQNKAALSAREMQEYFYGTAENPKVNWNLDHGVELVATGDNANLSYTHFAGQPNSGQHRGWGIYTNTGELVVEAYYNTNNDSSNNTDVSSDMGILFRYPTDGGKKMQKINANTVYGNPGVVLDYQVPASPVGMPEDTEFPIINYSHKNVNIYAVESDGLDHEIWVSVTDDSIVNTVYLEFKVSSDVYTSEYNTLQSFLRDGETSFYCAYLDFGNFIRKGKIEFRIIARDIVGKGVYTDWYMLTIIPYEEPLGVSELALNIKEGQYVGGDIKISATSQTEPLANLGLSLDGIPLETRADSQRYALFVYEVYETDFNFRNGVTIKNSLFGEGVNSFRTLFQFDISGKWLTYTVQIPLDMILPSPENPTGGLIGLHAGNRYTSIYDLALFEAAIARYQAAKAVNDAAGMAEARADFIYGDTVSMKAYQSLIDEVGLNLNRDDYSFRDVRLIMPDGTILYDVNPANGGKYSELMRDEIYRLSDSNAADTRQVFFKFDIPEEAVDTISYRIDTRTLSEGQHTLVATNGKTTKTVNFFVDNTNPDFNFTFTDGATLKGIITLVPEINETGSGVKERYGYLDGSRIGIPYYTTSGNLEPGLHTLEVTIVDKVGNKTTKTITFRTEEENPNRPVFESPEEIEGVDAQLNIRVSDPSNDYMTVEFFQGYRYSAENLNIFKGYYNSVEMEPPLYVVFPGEVEFTAEQYNKIKSLDGDYFDTQSYQLPYHRFAVTIDKSIPRNGIVNVRWYGKSLPGRKVTLYAWNIIDEEWVPVDFKIAGEGDFLLEADVTVEYYVDPKTNEVNILIQDEIEDPNSEKFTFAWISDPQYYTQRNAYDDEDHIILELMHNWLIKNRDLYNIKYLFVTGDLVNRQYEPYQWDVIDQYYQLLENARMPYGVLAGNHDVNFSQEDYSVFGEYFGEDRYKDKAWYGDSYQNNRGHYDLVSVNGLDFMMVYMGWGIYQPEIDWMNRVISENPSRIVILNFHEFMGTTGFRTAIGDEIYEKVVLPNPNVKMVLSGHLHGSSSRVDEIDDDGDGIADRKVWQLLADYQGSKNTASKYEGGDGFFRLFQFDPTNGEVSVITVSPWLEYLNELRNLQEGDPGYYDIYQALPHMDFEGLQNDSLAQNGNGTGSAYKSMDVATNSFVYEWELVPQIKRVATDAFFVNYRMSESLGKVENVKSGELASITWQGLEHDREYSWYVVITDANGGRYISDLHTFRTGEAAPSSQSSLYIWLIAGGTVLLGGGAAILLLRKKKVALKGDANA
jgi:hypothetical protein